MKEKWTKIRKVFFSTLYLSAFTFGGGYVIVTLMKRRFVDDLHWLDEDEMLDMLSSDGMLVKRPLVIGDDFALVGFKEDAYADILL